MRADKKKSMRVDDDDALDMTPDDETSANRLLASIDKRDKVKRKNEDILNCMVSDYDITSRRSHGVSGPRLMNK